MPSTRPPNLPVPPPPPIVRGLPPPPPSISGLPSPPPQTTGTLIFLPCSLVFSKQHLTIFFVCFIRGKWLKFCHIFDDVLIYWKGSFQFLKNKKLSYNNVAQKIATWPDFEVLFLSFPELPLHHGAHVWRLPGRSYVFKQFSMHELRRVTWWMYIYLFVCSKPMNVYLAHCLKSRMLFTLDWVFFGARIQFCWLDNTVGFPST